MVGYYLTKINIMAHIRHNDFSFYEMRRNEVYVIIYIVGYCFEEYVKVKLSMYDGLANYVNDNY